MNKQPVRIVQGTTNTFNIAVTDASGEAYTLTDGEKLILGVKRDVAAPDPLFTREATREADGSHVVTIGPDATTNLMPDRYFYDVSLQSGDDLFSIIELSAFDIIPGVVRWSESE